jgi:GPH family glycoside/pentoside/hexuronide:cation symporter
MFGLGICHQMVIQWAVFFYAPPPSEGAIIFLEIGQISAAMVLGRIVDAVSNPVVAYFSDRSLLRLGRRKPFMLWGSPFLLLAFMLLWRPPVGETNILNFFWALLMLGLFFFAYSMISVPYLALLPEIAHNDEERIGLASLQVACYGAGAGLGFLLSTIFAPFLGLPRLTLFLFPLIALTLLWPSLMVRENPAYQSGKISRVGFRATFGSLKNEKAFLFWIGTQAFAWTALIMLVMLLPYLLTVILGLSLPYHLSLTAVLVLIAGSTVGVLTIFRIIKKKGKDRAYQDALFFAGLAIALFSIIGLEGLPGEPQLQAALVFALLAGPLTLLLILPNAVVAEMSELRSARKGEHREALLYAGQGLVVKLSMAGGSALLGLLLFLFGRSPENPTGIRLASLLAGALLFSAIVFFHKFLGKKG